MNPLPGTGLVAEVSAPREDHGQVMAIGDLDSHLVTDGAARLDDGGHAALGRERDGIAEREIGIGRKHRAGGPVCRPVERDLVAVRRLD